MSGSRSGVIRNTLEEFVDELFGELDRDGQWLERVLRGDDTLSRDDLDSEPEEWTEDTLIFELIDDVGLHRQPGRPNPKYETPDWVDVEIPDFELEEGEDDLWIIGENKSVNKIEAAESDIQGYISKLWWPEFGIATDGIEWVAYRVEKAVQGSNGDDDRSYRSYSERVDLRPAIRAIADEKGHATFEGSDEVDVEDAIQKFEDVFAPEELVRTLTQQAPKELRDRRKRDVEAFYELYIELLFGESEEYEEEYDTNLREDIIRPPEASDKDRDLFAVTMVNRLLFIKFLENRGVLDEGFLTERVEAYSDELPRTLYKTVFDPLFYELLNTPIDDRPDHQQQGWMGDVPYLNGGLFRESINREREFDVENRTLPRVITDLVEGSELDFELNPGILGSVFEKTINHISSEEDLQKEIGAYYTPDDVTQLVNRQAVDSRIRHLIIEAYAEELRQPDEFRAQVAGLDFDELLVRIEDARGWFGNDDGMESALERINQMKILDSSCGSGHFLTSTMDEVHKVQQSIYRGLHGGDDPSRKERYEMKQALALNAVFGVDIDPVATEIAKLRVWLKIVEGNGWEEEFGRLPNIDINIVPGNSLIGLPAKSRGQSQLTSFDVDLSEIQNVRQEYKDGQISRRELCDRINELRPELREHFLDRMNHYIEHPVTQEEEWEAITDGLDQLYPTIRKVTVRDLDGSELDDNRKDELEDDGWTVEPRFGKSAKVEEEDIDRVGDIGSMLDDGFQLELERRIVAADLDEIEGHADLAYEPFHWPVEFPEAVEDSNGGPDYSVEFDIIVGNPPYGDVLTEAEKKFVKGYKTGHINDIVAPFIERQLHLLRSDGYFGNIHAMGILYQTAAAPVRDLLREQMEDGRMACFGHRPDTIFEGANPRAAVTTGRKVEVENGSPEKHDFETSDFILFYPEDREAAFEDIDYGSIEGLILGDHIGDEEANKAYPKVGCETSRSILESLRDENERLFADVTTRDEDSAVDTNNVVWRNYHPLYWPNPFLSNLYEDYGGSASRDFEPMYFETDLQRKAAFIIMQSSTFYHYWMKYENQRDLNWGPIDAFPFPEEDALDENEAEIEELADKMWGEMEAQFDGSKIPDGSLLKPVADEIDDLMAPLLGLDDEQVEWVKEYHTEFGRGSPEEINEKLETFQVD